MSYGIFMLTLIIILVLYMVIIVLDDKFNILDKFDKKAARVGTLIMNIEEKLNKRN